MTFVMRDYHGHCQPLADSDEAGEWFDEQTDSIMPNGRSGQVIWFGPFDGQPELRLDIDVETGRAALRWLAGGDHAIELDASETLTVMASADGDLVIIPARLARVSAQTARRAVIEYIATGVRPTGIVWEAD